MHSFGANFSYLTGKVKDQYSSSNISLIQTNLSYFPRVNIAEMENSSLSVGVPLGLGFGIAKSVNGDDAGIGFAYDLPIVLDYNIGCKSSYDNEGTFGGYFGLGFGYSHMSISESSYMDFKGTSYGPMVRAGIRIGSDSESWADHAITLGFSFKKGLEKEKLNTFGLSVLLDL